MELDDFYFEPKDVNAGTGQTLTLELENEGEAPHTFTIDELGIDEEVAPGEKATVRLTPEGDGAFPFYCRFHIEQGMQGTITVGGGSGASQGGASPPGNDDRPYIGY